MSIENRQPFINEKDPSEGHIRAEIHFFSERTEQGFVGSMVLKPNEGKDRIGWLYGYNVIEGTDELDIFTPAFANYGVENIHGYMPDERRIRVRAIADKWGNVSYEVPIPKNNQEDEVVA